MTETNPDTPATPTLEEMQKMVKDQNEAFKAQQERLNTLESDNVRLNGLLEAATRRPDPTPPTGPRKLKSDYATKYNVPNELIVEILDEAMEHVGGGLRNEWQQAEMLRQLAANFYDENPDLRGHKPIVQAMVNEVVQKNPTISIGEAMKQAGTKTKEYLKNIQGKGGGPVAPETPPPVVPGGGAIPPAAPKPNDQDLTPEQELAADMAERKKQKAAALTGARG